MPNRFFVQLCLAILLICALLGGAIRADAGQAYGGQADATGDFDTQIAQSDVLTKAGQRIPAGAFGILLIERPREMTLLNLRGIGGRGEVVLRGDEPGTCLTLAVRLVAGDFGGESITAHLAEPIRFAIGSRRAARALVAGQDIVSDMYRVSSRMDLDADIVLQSGLDESFGFVINPGRNIFSDVFGVTARQISCPPL